MRTYLAIIVSLFSAALVADVVYKDDGTVIDVPFSHEVIIQPKGYNSKAYNAPYNYGGMRNGRWPLLDALCKAKAEDGLGFGSSTPVPVSAPSLGFGSGSSYKGDPCSF